MAINSLDVPGDKSNCRLQSSSNSYKAAGAGYPPPCRLVKIDFATEGSICSAASKRVKKINSESKSPYLSSDNVHLLSQLTEKTLFHKKGTEFHSSYPLAVNIYKANSDEFKSLKRANRKARKSVLTLPNDPAPMPQICTVSDINDSEYFNQDEDRKKNKKRNPVPRNRLARPKGRDYEYYDRDARYCSQMDINLDCSSTDMIQNYNGVGKRTGKFKPAVASKHVEEKPNPHDVWAVLRNINRFQFRPSPPMSEDSFITPKKKKGVKRRNNRKDMRLVETCRTEEFAYISSIEVDSRSPHSFSKSSSFDRITVIDKQDEFSKICKEFEKRMVKTKNMGRVASVKPQNKIQNSKGITSNRNMLKANAKIPKVNNPKVLAIEYNSKKQCNNSSGDSKRNKMQINKDIPAQVNIKDDFEKSLNDKISENQFTSEINEADNVQHEFVYSGNSGSSKAAANNDGVNKKGRNRLSSDDFHNAFNGITKVILSKGPVIPPPKIPEPPKRKRQASIFSCRPVAPNSTISTVIPKLTQTDIKRRLTKLKFPIIILGTDEISSTYEVPNAEPTQFDGLKDQIWPFMGRWKNGEGDKQEDTLKTKTENPQKKKCSPELLEYNKTQKMNRGFISLKQHSVDQKPTNDSKNKNTTRADHKRITPPAELQPQYQPKKPKPIRQFKEKMLKLLYKNSSTQNFDDEKIKTGGCSDGKSKPIGKLASNKVDASTDTRIIRTSPKDFSRNIIHSPVKTAKQDPITKQPWAKGRWASDFIDNVIRKIKNDVYYTHEPKLPNKPKYVRVNKEVEMQTIATSTEDNPIMQSISKITIKKKPELTIPGFDNNTLPALEIKTMNMNEISVKHRVTNIMVYFDVTVPIEPVINLKRSSSLIPLEVTESETKIFKCKTSIINAMLPAELCSILPMMMWNIIESNQALPLSPVPVDKSTSHLSTIAEITRCESPEPYKISFLPHIRMTLELQKIINGHYPNKVVPTCKHFFKYHTEYHKHLAKEMLPCLSRSHLFDCEATAAQCLKDWEPKQTGFAPYPIPKTQLNTCMVLQPCSVSEPKLVPAYTQFDLRNLHRISNYVKDQIQSCSGVFNFFLDKNITIRLSSINMEGLQDTLSINFSRLMSSETTVENSLLDSDKSCSVTYKRELPAIQFNELKSNKNLQNQSLLSNKTRSKKRGFVKLYRKCKSTSNISAEKNSTALSKITNLEEFFQALGTAKSFSGVFDNIYSHNILSSLKEMKSWITDINPTQALLVLLLINKKDTPNLVRFRPVLLQGIAVNRITRANELDMEIEVIEREHLNRLTQYEGVSYLPASTENQDNLLEELCWIAKTTASDYQRTFDESSEKLLKSLLEKRKKLNPSYLRVMARYVGLGLLKSSAKK